MTTDHGGAGAESSSARIARWCAAYATALLGRDLTACERLLVEAASLPPAFGGVIESHITRAPRPDDIESATRAAEILTAPVAKLRSAVAAALAAGPASLTEQTDLRTALEHGLCGVWLDAFGATSEAAVSYYESGRHFSWAGDAYAQQSFDLLTRANSLDPSHVATYWQLASAWFGSTASDPTALQHSLETWERGASLHVPDADSSWAYVLRALISEELARTDEPQRLRYWWQAVVFLERAVLLNNSDPVRWVNLARMHRMLDNEYTALHVTAHAMQCDSQSLTVLEERAANLANIGFADDALTAIDARLEKDPKNAWARGVKAYILMQQKEYQAALELIDEVIAVEPTNTWNLDLRATCARMVGDLDAARAAYTTVLERRSTTMSSDDARSCIFAALNLRQPELAMSLLEHMSAEPDDVGDSMRVRGLCYLAAGRVRDAEPLLLCGVARANRRELDEVLSMDLPIVENMIAAGAPIAGAAAAARRVRRVAEALLDLPHAGTGDVMREADAELRQVLEETGSEWTVPWREAGARAGLARLQIESGRWREAASHYRALAGGAVFPEAHVGLERAVEGVRTAARQHMEHRRFSAAASTWEELVTLLGDQSDGAQQAAVRREIGDALWLAGNAPEALAQFEQSLTMSSGEAPTTLARLHARVALARQQLGQTSAARGSLGEALGLFSSSAAVDPGRALGEACRPLIRDVAHCWDVEAQWTAIEAECATADAKRAFASARESLLTYLDDLFHLGEETNPEKMLPVVTPIALGVGSDVVRLVDPKVDRAFIYTDIPAMRDRLQADAGLHRIPGIRVHEDATTRNGYVVLLDGAAVARGTVRLGQRYCAAGPAIVRDVGVVKDPAEEVADPVTHETGVWCPESSWETLTGAGLTLLSETEFILRHVEVVLRAHLDHFLGVQEAEDWIVRATADAQFPDAARGPLDDPPSRLLFAQALKTLASEGVAVTEPAAIVEGAQAARWSSVVAIVDQVRLRVKPQLPGNEKGTVLLEVPDGWRGLANGVAPDVAHQMLLAVRDWLRPYTMAVGLVTHDAAVRRVVRRLLEVEFPSVPVLTADEVLDPERLVAVTPAESALSQGLS